jgi:hypothetical protein
LPEPTFERSKTMDEEDRIYTHDIGKIAFGAALAASNRAAKVWIGFQETDDRAIWNAAAKAVLAWACNELDQEAKYGCPCNEDERVAWELTDKLRELGGLPQRNQGGKHG